MSENGFREAARSLSALDHLDVRELEILYKLEMTSGLFYFQLADSIQNEEVAEFLRRNGRGELGHARRIQQALTIRLGRSYQPSADMDGGYPLGVPPPVDAALLAAIARGERGGDADYQRWASAEPDPEIAHLLQINGREDSEHADRLTRASALLNVDR
ncbi:rubrerythrin [Frankia sp. CcI49]|uniref:ferritin-like domain-containing protein n=1 Tax=Frankia sp. CcI49 TaxID=1745382 RepID=UPI0009785E13|nr:ferritin-like domain-containing protein [Frankia sp. CcI49]ONH59768.1 rubrerythrin [Frankia sp. CcI49]